MGKRHNRKRTRSRPRHRDGNSQSQNHSRTSSVATTLSYSSTTSIFYPGSSFPIANMPAQHWHEMYVAWQSRLRFEQEQRYAMETQRLLFFGGEPGDEVSLLEPMLKVVTDLFDGNIDYEDP